MRRLQIHIKLISGDKRYTFEFDSYILMATQDTL